MSSSVLAQPEQKRLVEYLLDVELLPLYVACEVGGKWTATRLVVLLLSDLESGRFLAVTFRTNRSVKDDAADILSAALRVYARPAVLYAPELQGQVKESQLAIFTEPSEDNQSNPIRFALQRNARERAFKTVRAAFAKERGLIGEATLTEYYAKRCDAGQVDPREHFLKRERVTVILIDALKAHNEGLPPAILKPVLREDQTSTIVL